MKTLMISKGSWREIWGKCVANPKYIFKSEQLVLDFETVKTRNTAVGIVSSLKAIGIIDGRGKLTKLGLKWADRKTYPEACRELAEINFPQITRDALQRREKSLGDIVEEYANIVGMNEAGGRKNVRILSMLMRDAGCLEGDAVREVSSRAIDSGEGVKRGKGMKKQISAAKKEQVQAFSKDPIRVPSGTKALFEMTVPLEKLSDVTTALFSVVSSDEVSVDVHFI